jgi:hypothetical protein
MIRILLLFIAAGTLATSIADTAFAQQLMQRRDVSYAVALAIATARSPGKDKQCAVAGLDKVKAALQ